jgi:hypothetical protein
MKMHIRLTAVGIFATCLQAVAADTPKRSADELTRVVSALDTAVFDAFNRCGDPEQLAIHAGYFAEDVEFYHDNGGVTWTRDDMLGRTREFACGKYTRELVGGTLQVHPVKDFGAIAQGVHRFCETGSDRCDGLADFIMVWREQGGRWELTRVLSYGHRAADSSSANGD